MQTDETAEATDALTRARRGRFLAATFRNILLVVFLIFVFAVVRTFILWAVCNAGMKNAVSLENQGLPALKELSSLQENLALYRLNSYEYLFAQYAQKAADTKAADDLALQMRAELKNIQTLFPEGEGRQLAANLEKAVDDLDAQFRKVRGLVDADFPAAMKSMDQDIPPRTERVDAGANALEKFGYQFSGAEASATFASFGSIKNTAVIFGIANCVVAFCAFMFVLLAARRSRAQLAETLARLDERSQELSYERDLLRSLLDSSPDQIYFKDAQSRFIKSSNAQAQSFGLQNADELVGKTDFDYFTEEHARPAFEEEQEIIRNGVPMIGQVKKEVWKDGRVTWALTNKIPLRDKDGRIIGTFGISKDITVSKQAEAELAYQRDLLGTLMDHSPDSIFFKDLQSRFVKLSRSEANNLLRVSLSHYHDLHPAGGDDVMPSHLASVEEFEKYIIGKSDAEIYGSEQAGVFGRDEKEIIRTGQPMIGKIEQTICPDRSVIWFMTTKLPWRNKEGEIIGTFGIAKEISELKSAEAKLEQVHKQLLKTSRQAGMTEIATNVLHNVGNVLNSVNVSASLVADNVRKSKVASLFKVVALLREHEQDLGTFFTSDPRGKQLSTYLSQLSEQLLNDQKATATELDLLRGNIEHIKEIVAMQQSYARVSGVTEIINLRDLVEDGLRMNVGALTRHGVNIVREFEDVPLISIDKHKVLQVLVNLIRNAKHACQDSERADKQMTVRLFDGDGRIKISVRDNGIGIPPENLTRIFSHGFTTKKDGHGFGLHSGALAAKELGGSLNVQSDGIGRGATFTLELPVRSESTPEISIPNHETTAA
jgi:PAS domain S-box-containing protein